CDACNIADIGNVGAVHGERGATGPRNRIATTHTPLEPSGGRDQEVIPAQVAALVVDELEPVEVEERDAEHCARITLRSAQLSLETFNEQCAIWQPGECVVERVVLQLLFGALPFRDVVNDADHTDDIALRSDV